MLTTPSHPSPALLNLFISSTKKELSYCETSFFKCYLLLINLQIMLTVCKGWIMFKANDKGHVYLLSNVRTQE